MVSAGHHHNAARRLCPQAVAQEHVEALCLHEHVGILSPTWYRSHRTLSRQHLPGTSDLPAPPSHPTACCPPNLLACLPAACQMQPLTSPSCPITYLSPPPHQATTPPNCPPSCPLAQNPTAHLAQPNRSIYPPTCVEEALIVQRLLGLLLVLVVASKHGGAADADLALHQRSGLQFAYGAEPEQGN